MFDSIRVMRREFMGSSAAAVAGYFLAGEPSPARASGGGSQADAPRARLSLDAALQKLIEGNKRFRDGRAKNPRRKPEDFSKLVQQQNPIAVIVGCADSRVSPELLFDQGVGDLFVVRVAGNVVSGAGAIVKGSIEYAVAELGVSLIVVLGHSGCGAVKSALKHIDANDPLPGAINELVGAIKPAVAKSRNEAGDPLENAIKANVRVGVERLEKLEPLLAASNRNGKLKIVGGVYDLRSGSVEIIAK